MGGIYKENISEMIWNNKSNYYEFIRRKLFPTFIRGGHPKSLKKKHTH